MRPKLLEIEGLQSYIKKQRVDFEKLGETGLFGIFGPTGSGKSTVLDAITLALYGEVNRALSGTQGIINTGAANVKVLFEFELKKGNEKKTYRVERLYHKKKGTENSSEAKVARLIEIRATGEFPLADKPREVTGRVEELIGLRHDDFMRAVVLPQNRFQEFLMLEKAKKREMLERIFYLEEYGKQLTDKVASRVTAVRERLLTVQGELLALGDASEASLKAAELALMEIQEKRDRAIEDYKLAEAGFNKARELWQLAVDLELLESREKEHMLTAGSIEEKTRLLERVVRAKSLEDIIARFENASKSLEFVMEKLEPLSVLLPQYEKELSEAKALRDTTAAAAGREKQQLIERKLRLNRALTIKNEIAAVSAEIDKFRTECTNTKDIIIKSDRKIEDKQNYIEKLKNDTAIIMQTIEKLSLTARYREEVQEAVKLEEGLDAAEKTNAAEKKHYDELAAVIAKLGERLAEASLEFETVQNNAAAIAVKQAENEKTSPGDRETVSSEIAKYHRMKAAVSVLDMKKADADNILLKAVEAQDGLKKQKERLLGLLENKKRLESDIAEMSAEAEQLRAAMQQNTANLLAAQLEDGKPCPVCGSLHHPVPAAGITAGMTAGSDSEDERLIEQIGKNVKEAEGKISELTVRLREAENSCTIAEEQIRGGERQLKQLNDDASSRKSELYSLIAELKNELTENAVNEEVDTDVPNETNEANEANDIAAGIEHVKTKVEGMGSRSNVILKAIESWELLREQLNRQALAAGNELASAGVRESAARAELKANQENIAHVEKTMKAAEAAYEEKKAQYSTIAEKLGIESAIKEYEKIREKDTKVEELRKEAEKLQETASEEAVKLELLREERRQLAEKYATVVNDGKHMKEQKDAREAELLELAGSKDISVENEIMQADARAEAITQNEKKASERVEELDEKLKSLSMQKNTLEGQRNTFAASLDEIEKSLKLLIQEKGFKDINDAKSSIISSEKTKALEDEIKTYRQEESNLKAQKALLLKKLDGHTINRQEWDDIQQCYSSKLAEKDESVSACEVAKNVYATLKQRYVRWASLSAEFKAIEHKAAMLDHIKSLLKGNSFIEYVAEERLRYIAREASETLGIMTRYRYALELDSDNGFVIRDNASGGVHRPVTSLSGGEVFLTSLSLALALSSQIHLKGQSPLEFFFLDEGFGTLDNNLLDLVIDSLERISSQERVIGLISHVPELKNRISRRLVITPPDQDGNGSRVTIEKA